ncbi:hypothetical protein J5069_07435 [Candidatus Symbiopectobacterium sp. NZEC127]|uniref:STY1053 family phage-associated protein n=1 Tax=Candidatus Symbiopectobacterium sp. NZEC127 TaxID=2820472 RepID=UPI0022275426|nr:hypothetical protein [Candidatus Symbiopectobacterium sp. NZEC127]MCW2485728.1 hypothetical protein [Candidatus Symbiopectobacterium sp. NZEC127]
MKYIVSGGATLSFPDGTRFELQAGIHDSNNLPDSVRKHWAFKSYAKPLDESELEQEKQTEDLSAQLAVLSAENESLKTQLIEQSKISEDLSAQLAGKDTELAGLKEQLSAALAATEKGTNAKK